jgi:hypothetical protein
MALLDHLRGNPMGPKITTDNGTAYLAVSDGIDCINISAHNSCVNGSTDNV